ncbi:phosphotransferase [Prolixibacter bellariivorans]|uniref:Phosphotransferase n=1 Tax=Prolixibacter bellariivorans TaxID=314319 RepID=A0A5M4B0X8_9BACT|nr:RNase adapter RapZ [Prolixibacter bellariivorans]GET33819.1 phosphotransferase [Prolixibacter bellariivorans]
MKKTTQEHIIGLFEKTFGEKVTDIEVLPPSGSYREYCRLISENRRVIGAWNEDDKENRAFIEFSKALRGSGINVPEIYGEETGKHIYLQQDLGNTTLFQFLSDVREKDGFSPEIIDVYRKVVAQLPHIQVKAGGNINYDYCYPRDAFDRQSMMWDLNYFKYYFLKLAKISFDEQSLEDDFQRFTDYLLEVERDFFLYRDFQSRNVMLMDGEPWFIDYQGGRKGALQYDLASLLYDSKADIPQPVRDELLESYLDELEKYHPVNRKDFREYFYGYVLIRMMQSMGAYGFRGFYEKKEHFLKSIPYALENLVVVLDKFSFPVELPELEKVLRSLPQSETLKKIASKQDEMTVRITSFSYKKGVPQDPSGNGGGYVFDCRAVHNPGRYEQYKTLTGKDPEVIAFFEEESEMENFLRPVFNLVDQSVEKYLERKFNHLMVNFGCTGGQHRSVYAAERLSEHLKNKYPVRVVTFHREQEAL